jgi:hypothetical protein
MPGPTSNIDIGLSATFEDHFNKKQDPSRTITLYAMMVLALFIAFAISGAVAQAPKGTSTDPFAPNGALGQAMQAAGNITNGPAPKGCSKFEILVG